MIRKDINGLKSARRRSSEETCPHKTHTQNRNGLRGALQSVIVGAGRKVLLSIDFDK